MRSDGDRPDATNDAFMADRGEQIKKKVPAAAMADPSPFGERAHDAVERGFCFEADAGEVGQADERILDRAVVGEAAEWGEDVGVAFVAAEPEPNRAVEGELVAAMRHAPPRPPTVALQHVEAPPI